jgi:hypothetical protein
MPGTVRRSRQRALEIEKSYDFSFRQRRQRLTKLTRKSTGR